MLKLRAAAEVAAAAAVVTPLREELSALNAAEAAAARSTAANNAAAGRDEVALLGVRKAPLDRFLSQNSQHRPFHFRRSALTRGCATP